MDNNFVEALRVLTGNNDTIMGIEEQLLEIAKNEGIELGRTDAMREIITTMLSKGLSPEQIAETINVPIAVVQEVKNNPLIP